MSAIVQVSVAPDLRSVGGGIEGSSSFVDQPILNPMRHRDFQTPTLNQLANL